jgi:uncharacterized protein (TIGR03083 family)
VSVGHDPPGDLRAGVATYLGAAEALYTIGRRFGPEDWDAASACPGWDAATLVGHVLCVARWHHGWLDRAEAGDTSIPWPPAELDARNRAALDELEVMGAPDRLDAFRISTSRYAERLSTSWELPFAYPGGLLTAGWHALLAAGEWHLHAWDLGRAIGIEHTADATLIRAAWTRLGRRIEADGDPWRALLNATGRVA